MIPAEEDYLYNTYYILNNYLSNVCNSKENYHYIDAYNYFIEDNVLNSYYYLDDFNLNRLGYTKLNDIIYQTLGNSTPVGQTFSNTYNGKFKATKGLEYQNDRMTEGSTMICNQNNEQYAYYKEKLKAKFSFDVCFDLKSYDSSSKVGIFLQDENNTLLFYINPETKEVGYQTKVNQNMFLGSCKKEVDFDNQNARLTWLKKDSQNLLYLNVISVFNNLKTIEKKPIEKLGPKSCGDLKKAIKNEKETIKISDKKKKNSIL